MKLFLWINPYPVSYGCSMVFAVADSLEQAKAIAASKVSAKHYTYGIEHESGQWTSDLDLGEPQRIVDLPCAEWHEWSE